MSRHLSYLCPFPRLHPQTVIYSEGTLFLDDCDFSESSASALVFSGDEDNTVIRNAVLGNKNCERDMSQDS